MNTVFVIAAIICSLGAQVTGHANMVWPPTWFDEQGYFGMRKGEACNSGAILKDGTDAPSCMWFNNYTFIDGPETLDKSMTTYFNRPFGEDPFAYHPWRSPGAAEIFSPCGVAGGNPWGCPIGNPNFNECKGGGFSYGPYAENYRFPGVLTTTWKRGSVVEAAWSIMSNHGGGYSYRLCKLPPNGNKRRVTEKCFQKIPLKFAGEDQWIQYGTDKSTRITFKANYTTVGTTPKGSQWAKNPIPACNTVEGGWEYPDSRCRTGVQFPPPAPGLQGYGDNSFDPGNTSFKFNIGDYLQVPKDIAPGKYVLSWRWDCEQTSQVWATCADIKIV